MTQEAGMPDGTESAEVGTMLTTDPRDLAASEPGDGPGEAETSAQTAAAGEESQAEGDSEDEAPESH
jgi:hypothetical protein